MTGITRKELGLHQRWAEVAMREQQPVTTINTVVLYELCRHALTEQSRIDEAVAKERERCAKRVELYATRVRTAAEKAVHSGPLLISTAESAERLAKAIRTPTPTTEEGA